MEPTSSSEDRPFWRWVLGLTGFGFLLRVGVTGFTNRPSGNGALHFLPNVEPFARGDFASGFEIAVPPGAAAVAAPFWWLFRDSELAFNAATVLAGTALIPIAAALARQAFGWAAGLWTAGFVTLSSHSLMYAALTEAEIIYGFFVGLGLLGALRWFAALEAEGSAPTRGVLWATLTGAALGCSVQSRPEGMALPFLVVGFALVVLPWIRGRQANAIRRLDWAPRAFGAVIIFALVAIVCAPYSAYLYRTTGQLHFSGKLNSHLLEDGDSHRLTDDDRFTIWEYTLRVEPFDTASPLESRTDAPLFFRWWRGSLRYLQNTPRYTDWVPILGLVGLIVSGIRSARRGTPPSGSQLPPPLNGAERRAVYFFVGILVFYYLALPVVLTTWRLFIPYLPLLFSLAAWGFVRTLAPLSPRFRRNATLLLAILFTAFCLSSIERRHIRDYGWTWQTSPERRLGTQLKDRLGGESTPLVEFINGSVYHYAGGLHLIYPACGPEAFDRHCRLRGIEYVVIDSERVDPERYHWHEGLAPTPKASQPDPAPTSVLERLGFEQIGREVEPGTERELRLFYRAKSE